MAEDKRARVLLGRIVGAFGIRGEVIIQSYAEVPESIGAYGALSDAGGLRTFEIAHAKATAKGVVARIAGIADRNAAEALKGIELYVLRDRLPAAAEDEFYHADLVGLVAVSPDGAEIGRIVAVHNFGAGDLIEVKLAGAARTELVPFTEMTVPQVDLAAGRAVVVLPTTTEARDDDGK